MENGLTASEVEGLINRRRRQILIHSFLYYRMNTSIVSDAQYDQWARELAELQARHPEVAKKCAYADAFEDFSESVTGFNLPLHDPWVVGKGQQILRIHEKRRTIK